VPGDHARCAQRAHAQSDVDAVGNQVDDAIVEAQVEFDARVAPRELRQCRQQQVAPECDRHIDPQLALWSRPRVAQVFFGIAQFVEDAAAAA
jgi:hypothetical protein